MVRIGMSGEQKERLEKWGLRVSVTLGLFTFVGTVLAAGAWAESQRREVLELRGAIAAGEVRVRELDESLGRTKGNLEVLNRNLIRMAVKAGVPRGEMEDLR
jgi:hypothetical protein